MITSDKLASLYPRAPKDRLDSFVNDGPGVLKQAGITDTPNRLFFFLAQLGHESGGLTIVEENLNYSAKRLMVVFPKRFPTPEAAACAGNPEALGCQVYGGRLGNAKLPSKDGYLFRGRGYIQLTGRANYTIVGDKAGIKDLPSNPDRAATPANALALAAAFWTLKNINETADADDFVDCTRRVNGGLIGIAERRAWLNKVRRVFADPPANQPDAATVLGVQKRLVKLGYTEVGAPDGDIGRHTTSAIARFRQKNGLSPGMIDDQLLTALGLS
ncbi:peptidoglycan-binding protein [Sphingomonas phyllosphaerae]|uniref:peptidoglycan-binding protein n=1 Tax=Sphingomonas phyllosphaerae TaxID=257003 RepID=UPI00041BB889|nr:peptidoglycan-binding protein [Sphingomonas phyllosphaerae]